MPSNTHDRITAPGEGFPESPISAGPRLFYLGALAHLKADEPPVVLRFNGDATDEVILCAGSSRLIGRGPNRPIQSFQARALGGGDATLTLEFTEDPLPDGLVWHSTGPAGAPGPMGPQGDVGLAGPGAASVRARAFVGANPISVAMGGVADLVADVEQFNVGAGYDAATGVLTVPVGEGGEYLVAASATTAASALELEVRISTNGGGIWSTVSRSPRSVNGARIVDMVRLDGGNQLKFVVHNPNGVAVDVLGAVANEARSYLAITRVA